MKLGVFIYLVINCVESEAIIYLIINCVGIINFKKFNRRKISHLFIHLGDTQMFD